MTLLCPFIPAFAGTPRKLLWPLPCADRGSRRPSSAAADEHAPPWRHPRADNGEPAFAGWQNPRGTRSAASSPRYVRDRTRAAGAGVAAPREGVRAVPAVTGRYVRVPVGGAIYQIYSEALGAGHDVLCMNSAGADTTRLVRAGSSGACAGVTIGRQNRGGPAANILAANQPGRC